MVEEGTLCSNACVKAKAGAKASTVSTAEAYTNNYIKISEGLVCTITRYDWVTNYASVSTIGKEFLREATASIAAINAISYDMSGYTSKQEALIMVNILWAQFIECIKLLKDNNNYKDFILTGAGDID